MSKTQYFKSHEQAVTALLGDDYYTRKDFYSMKPKKGSKRNTIEYVVEFNVMTPKGNREFKKKNFKETFYKREDFIPVETISDCTGNGVGIMFGTGDKYITIPTERLDDFLNKFHDDNLIELINKHSS
jgi:hypothetical protein